MKKTLLLLFLLVIFNVNSYAFNCTKYFKTKGRFQMHTLEVPPLSGFIVEPLFRLENPNFSFELPTNNISRTNLNEFIFLDLKSKNPLKSSITLSQYSEQLTTYIIQLHKAILDIIHKTNDLSNFETRIELRSTRHSDFYNKNNLENRVHSDYNDYTASVALKGQGTTVYNKQVKKLKMIDKARSYHPKLIKLFFKNQIIPTGIPVLFPGNILHSAPGFSHDRLALIMSYTNYIK